MSHWTARLWLVDPYGVPEVYRLLAIPRPTLSLREAVLERPRWLSSGLTVSDSGPSFKVIEFVAVWQDTETQTIDFVASWGSQR